MWRGKSCLMGRFGVDVALPNSLAMLFCVECLEGTAPESKDDGKDVTMRGPLFLLLNLT